MPEFSFEVEAYTLDEARELARVQIPKGLFFFSDQVIDPGQRERIRGIGATTDEALARALAQTPKGMAVIDSVELQEAKKETQIIDVVDGYAEVKMRLEMNSELAADLRKKFKTSYSEPSFGEVREISAGKQGFLGFRSKVGQYELDLFYDSVVEVIFSTKQKLEVKISTDPKAIRSDAQLLLAYMPIVSRETMKRYGVDPDTPPLRSKKQFLNETHLAGDEWSVLWNTDEDTVKITSINNSSHICQWWVIIRMGIDTWVIAEHKVTLHQA